MNARDSKVGSQPDRSDGQQPGVVSGRLSRRQALRRLGLGAAGGTVAWVAPEILIGRPTAASASAAPAGGGPSGGLGGVAGGSGRTPYAAQPDTPDAAQPGTPDAAQPNGGSGNQLAFTGLNVERALEAGAGLLVGGWLLTRWSTGQRDGEAGEQSPDQRLGPS